MWLDLPRPLIIAHRGASSHSPENTLAAFELAFTQGADAVELDAKLSADGEVVVIHDPTVDRTTDGHGRVSQLTLADLRGLDAGSFFSDRYHGEQIPSLSNVFETLGGKILINIELTNYSTPRDSLVEKVCGLVKKHALENNVILSSFLSSNLRKALRLLPELPRGLLALGGWAGAWARSFGFAFGDYTALHTHFSDTNSQQVGRVHRLKRRIHVWTVNNAREIARLKACGVDGIFTDDPLMALGATGRVS